MGRSKAKKPTLDQKKLISEVGLDPRDWLVLEDTEASIRLVHRSSGESLVIIK